MAALDARVFAIWPLRFALSVPRRRLAAAPVALLAIALPLAGCSFDLGSWGSATTSHRRSSRSRPARSAGKASATRRATPRAARRCQIRQDRRSAGGVRHARSRSILTMCEALYGRGLIYQGEKQHQQAIEDFTAANGLTPQRVEPLLARATSYLALDKTKEAASDLDEAVQADPNNAQAWSARGVTYERLGDKAKASSFLRPRARAAPQGRSRTKRPRADRRLGFQDRIFTSAARRGRATSPSTARLRRRPWCVRVRKAPRLRHADRAGARAEFGRRRRAVRVGQHWPHKAAACGEPDQGSPAAGGADTMTGGGSGRSAGADATLGDRPGSVRCFEARPGCGPLQAHAANLRR